MEFTLTITGSDPSQLQNFLTSLGGASPANPMQDQLERILAAPEKSATRSVKKGSSLGPSSTPLAPAAVEPAPAQTETPAEVPNLIDEMEAGVRKEIAASPAPAPAAPTKEIKIEDVRAAVQAAAKAGKREDVTRLLQEAGAENVSKLNPIKYQWFMGQLAAAVNTVAA